jgi:hypothetical protein
MTVTKPYCFTCFGDIHGSKPYKFIGFRWPSTSQTPVARGRRIWGRCWASGEVTGDGRLVTALLVSVELSHILYVSDPRRNTHKSAQNRSKSLCGGLWVPCRIFSAGFGPVVGPDSLRNRRFPAGSLKVVGALVAEPSRRPQF